MHFCDRRILSNFATFFLVSLSVPVSKSSKLNLKQYIMEYFVYVHIFTFTIKRHSFSKKAIFHCRRFQRFFFVFVPQGAMNHMACLYIVYCSTCNVILGYLRTQNGWTWTTVLEKHTVLKISENFCHIFRRVLHANWT